jgi:hypothetical protein
MKNIITQIIIAVAVIFCGSGCVSQIWSEKEFSVALNDNANFEKGLVGWMVQEGEVDVVSGIEGPMPGEKSLRLRTAENGRVRLESVQSFSFKAGESYLIGASVQGFNPVWKNSSGIRGEEGEIRIGPVPISKVRGGYSFWSEDLIVKWPRISGTFQVDQDFEGPLWIEVRASNRRRSLNFLLDNFFISSLTGRLPQPVLSGKPIDLSEGLLAYYPFSGDAKDASGNNHHGVAKGASLGEDRHSKPSGAYFFDGIDNYIEIKDSPELRFDPKGTVSFWVKAQSWRGGSVGIISKKAGDGEPGIVIYRNTYRPGHMSFRIEPEDTTGSNKQSSMPRWARDAWPRKTVEIERWEHWCVSWDGAVVRWFHNGTVNAGHTKEWIKGSCSNTVPLHIGHAQTKQWGGTYFHGGLDDIRIYNRVLPAGEIAAIYAEEKPLKIAPTPSEIAIENAIRLALNMPKGELDQGDYDRVSELDLSNKKIHNISSLTKLRKLKKINLRGNLVADFQPLTKLPELEYLFISTDGVSIDHLHRLGKFESVTEFHLERTHNMNNGTYISALVGKSTNLEKLHLYLPGLYDRSPIYGCKGHAKLKLIDMTHAPQPKDVRDALIKHFNPDKEIIFKENK